MSCGMDLTEGTLKNSAQTDGKSGWVQYHWSSKVGGSCLGLGQYIDASRIEK